MQQIPVRTSSTLFRRVQSCFLVLSSIALLLCLLSCGEGKRTEQASESAVDTTTADYAGDMSYDEGLSSDEVKVLIHSGTPTILNFCFCCDCKITKPALNKAVESSGLTLFTATIDVKERIDLAEEYGVERSPFYILYDQEGTMLDTLYGYGENELLDDAALSQWLTRNIQTGDRR